MIFNKECENHKFFHDHPYSHSFKDRKKITLLDILQHIVVKEMKNNEKGATLFIKYCKVKLAQHL